ncbi:MAG TPA: TonB-dependent receptor [Candidatus Dormibacteraeota bacterium]|nr:TonB-dependent receptor [Candidatus Dormibacteraeota bacterium]
MSCGAVAAQDDRLQLEPVVVTATRLAEPVGDVPASVSIVEGVDVQGGQRGNGLQESLDRVPGVLVQNADNFAQDVRIQIRGFGTRAAFGIREVRVLLDGFPETQPDGQTQIDDIDLGSIERIEVLRGPAGALYGNASGGVIQLFSRDAPPVPTATLDISGGSYSFGKYQLEGGARAGKASAYAFGSFLQLGGYRQHSDTQSGTWLAKLRYDFTDDTDLTMLANGVDTPVANDPGGLTAEQVAEDPRQARDLNVQLDAGENVQQARFGFTLNHRAESSDLNVYGYVITRDFENALPIRPMTGDGIVTFNRVAPGGGARWTLFTPVLGFDQTLTLGLDLQYQDDDRSRYPNIDGERGALSVRQREQVGSVGPYLREAVMLRPDLELSAGLRYDAVLFDVGVDTPADSNQSGSRTFDQLSPTGGIRWTWLDGRPAVLRDLSLFATIGTAFQTPTTTELVNPSGAGFNPDVQPQTSVTYELGGRAHWPGSLVTEASTYYIEVADELVQFEAPNGHTGYRNAGHSRRYGLELDWQARLLAPLRWSGGVTLIKSEYTDYQVGETNFAGNDEPGIPQWWIFQELRYDHPLGFFAALQAYLVDGYFVNDANTASTQAYELLNLRAGYQVNLGDHWSVAPYVGFNNLANQNYIGTVRLNALGGRYFEPAPTFNTYAGIAVIARL